MIKIKNWQRFQSYKDRKPPWIRLQRTLLDNYSFHRMSANARALLPMLWLLASENSDPKSGQIDLTFDEIAFRLRQNINDLKKAVNEMAHADFVELNHECNESVTKPYSNRIQTVTPETETETETETDISLCRKKNLRHTPLNSSFDFFLASLKKSNAYPGLDIEREVAKMKNWLALPQNAKRKLTQRFVVNWLNRIDIGEAPKTNQQIAEEWLEKKRGQQNG
jgi:hypothetical protein